MFKRIGLLLSSLVALSIGYGEAVTGQYRFDYKGDSTTVTWPLGGTETTRFSQVNGQKLISAEVLKSQDGKVIAETRYEYDSRNQPQKVTYPNGSSYETHYDDKGLLLSKTEHAGTPLAFTTNYTWTEARLPKTIHYSNGLSVGFEYDAHNEPLTVTRSDGTVSQTWTYTYDKWAQPLTAQAPYNDKDHLIKYTYNAQEMPATISNQLGQTVTYGKYDELGNLLSKTDENGVITEYTYDPMGLLLSASVNGNTTTFYRDGNDHLSELFSAEGAKTIYDYNYWGDLKKLIDAQDNKIIQTLDGMGNVVQRVIVDSSGNEVFKVNYTYNSLNELQSITDANGHSTSFEYDVSGNVIKTTNAKGDATNNQYNIQNNVSGITNALSNTSTLSYDPSGNVTSISDYNGNVAHYQYNAFNQLTEVDSPDTGKMTYSYNDKGQLANQKDATGKVLSYAYDQLNRITEVSNHNTPVIQYNYDQGQYGIGRLSSIKNPISEISSRYDAWGNIIQQSYVINGTPYAVGYGYNKDRAINSITYPSGLAVSLTRDKIGNITGVTVNSNGTPSTIASAIAYLPFGPMKSLTFGNGGQLTRTYDKAYQLTQQVVTGVSDDHYLYDKLGNITQFISKDEPTKSKDYVYDAISRLTSMKSQLETEGFSYDANGNRLSYVSNKDGQTAEVSYQYDKGSNKLSSYQDAKQNTVTHDNNGNITQLGELSFAYDVFNNLTKATKDGKELANYEYSPYQQRIVKTVNGNQTVFIYDIGGKLIEIRAKDAIIDIIYLNGEPIAQLVNGATYYFVNDALGTPQYLTGQNGQKQWSGNINPFEVNASGQVQQDLRFAGQVANPETGLVYNNAREYVPFLGRYLQADPLGLASGSLNNYTYVGNNPINLIDPSGLMPDGYGFGIDAATQSSLNKLALNQAKVTYQLASEHPAEFVMAVGAVASLAETLGASAMALTKLPSIYQKLEQAAETQICARPSGGAKKADGYVDLASPQRRRHILDGDATGGGHRPGTAEPGKSEFPKGWSDDKIMHEISDVATDPNAAARVGHGGRTITEGTRDGIDIRVIQEHNGDIVSGFPTNVPRNIR